MKQFYLAVFIIFLFPINYSDGSDLSESDLLFQEATEAVKEKRYLKAINLFEKLGNDFEADAQYNLAILLKSGRGKPQDYKAALKWGWLSLLGNIEAADKLVDEIKGIVPELDLKKIRKDVKEFIQVRAEKGDNIAISQMGNYFLVVPETEEYKDAYLWFLIAAAFQIDGSIEKRDRVEGEVESKDILKIQSKALELFEKISQTKK